MKTALFIGLSLLLVGCSASTPEPAKTADSATSAGASGQTGPKRYPMHGKVLGVDAAEKSAKIDAGPIGDWMGAMTMSYPVKDSAELAKMSAGSTIDATVFVDGDNFWVGEVKMAAATAASGAK